VDEFVREAERVCLSAEAPPMVDATELQEADADGLALLAKILAGGGRIEGLSKYLAMRARHFERGAGKCEKPRAPLAAIGRLISVPLRP